MAKNKNNDKKLAKVIADEMIENNGNLPTLDKVEDELGDEKKKKFPKKLAKRAEDIVRKMDNITSDLYTLSFDIGSVIQDSFEYPSTDIPEKDIERLHEIQDILQSVSKIMYRLTERMSRKYVGKSVEPVEGTSRKRKALKK